MASLVSDLRAAIRDHRIEPHFQPQIDLTTDEVVGVEALARWTDAHRGVVAPVDFIAAAEGAGLAGDLDRCMLEASCEQLAVWRSDGHDLELAVNVSPPELDDPGFCEGVLSTLGRHGVPVDVLTLELTEQRALSYDETATTTLHRSQKAGMRFSLDDFGTGMWVLDDIQRLQPRELKLDRTVIQGGYTGYFAGVVERVHASGGRVVAEGIETEAHLATARALGCDRAQGYLFGSPLSPAALAEFLD